MIPGEFFLADEDIQANTGRKSIALRVTNTGDRPVQVGSHYHFFEVNRGLEFNRDPAFGMRLNIPAGTAVRFEPGEEKEVKLIGFSGKRCVYGLNGLTEGSLDQKGVKKEALGRAGKRGFIKPEEKR